MPDCPSETPDKPQYFGCDLFDCVVSGKNCESKGMKCVCLDSTGYSNGCCIPLPKENSTVDQPKEKSKVDKSGSSESSEKHSKRKAKKHSKILKKIKNYFFNDS
uniref:Uncharacterized protein n=1 Tax=Acrobeloides nanus TaxID=290746 RepID=A0A914BUY1_9BILA